ncbi:hypothetical protein F4604DRAFT_674364 [Suillus subluteus]|nr:hypothetical protein F4604DRAFT_674364 [Suillus subluteus]
MACALIFICTRADGYLCDFSWIVVSYVHVCRISVFRRYLPSLSFSLFSYVYFTDLIVVLISIVYLEVCRLSREISASLYIYSYA